MDFDNLNDFGSLAAPTWGGSSSSSSSGDAFPMDYADVPSLSHAPLRRSGMSANNNNNFGGFADPFNNSDPNDWSRAMLDITSIPLPMPERMALMPEKFSLDLDLLASSLSMPVSDTAYIGGGFGNSNNINNINNNNNGIGSLNLNNGNVPLVFPGLARVRTDSRRPFASASPVCMTMAGAANGNNNGNNSNSNINNNSNNNGSNSNSNSNNNSNNSGLATATVDPFDYVNDIPEELLRFDLPSELTDNLQSFSIQQQEADDADEPVSPIRVKVEGKRTKTATRRTHTRRQPTRDDFSTDAEFEEELQLWKRNREINNESVKRSRERLNQELACKKTELKTRQTQNADIVREIEVLRSEQVLLNRFSQSPMAIQEKEKSELRRILLLHLQGMEDPVDAKQEDEEDVD